MDVITKSKNFALYSNKANSHARMYITQGEYATPLATFTLYDGDSVFNLTGIQNSSILCSVYLTNNINRAVTLPVTIVDAAAGKITVATTQELTATYDGNGFDCYVQIVSQSTLRKWSGMKIFVQPDPTLDIIAQSPNAQTLIDALNKLALINGGTGTVTVDDALSTSSANPVQNKKITAKINEIDEYLSGHSFMYDAYGRIFSYTDATVINSSHFSNKQVAETNGCYVWLCKKVTSVQSGALPDAQYIHQIIYEGSDASNLTLASEYQSVNLRVGRWNHSVFYMLATLAYLYNNTLKTGDAYSKTDSDSRYRKTSTKITIDDFATALANLINGKADSANVYTKTESDNKYELLGHKIQSNNPISSSRQTTTADNANYPSVAALKTFIFNNFYTMAEIDNLLDGVLDADDDESIVSLLANKLDKTDGSVKTNHINTGAVTEEKLATALSTKINAKINTSNAVKFVSNESLDNCTLSDTIYYVYTTDGSGVTGKHVVICSNATNQRTQYLFAQGGGIQYRKQVKSGGAFGDWGSWTKLATTATTTQLSDAITALNTAVESLQQNAIMKAQGAVIESYINGGAVTEAKLATELSNKINGKINSSEAIKYQSTASLDNCTSQDTIYKYYGYDMQGFTGNHLVLCLATANSKTTQILFSSKGLIQYRTKEYQGEYSEWKEVATTSQTTALSSSLSALRQRVTDLENTRITKTQGAVIEDYINNGAVTKAKLAPALKAELDDKLSTTSGVIFVNSQNANECLAQNTLYVLQTEIDGHIQNTHTLICSKDIDNRAQYRFSVDGGFEYRTQEGLVQEGNPWSEWKAFATSGALSDVATSLSENYYTITQIDNALNVINTAISNLNSTVEFKANKVSDIDSSTFVATAEETQYPSVGAIKRLVNSQIYRKAEIDTQLGTHIHNAELWYGLPVTVGFDNYKIPVAVIEGNLINKSMISNNSITTLYIAANVTEVASDILDGSNIATIYVDMDYNDGAILLENVEGLENVDNVYYKDGNYNFNKYLAKALAYIRSLIVNLNSASQRIEAKADTATTYGISVVLDSSDWNNNLQSVDISSLYTVTQNTDIKINISDTVYSQLDSCGCESICVNAELVNDSYILKFEVEGRAPATNITVDLLLTEVVNLS